jgi:hypothetical protein
MENEFSSIELHAPSSLLASDHISSSSSSHDTNRREGISACLVSAARQLLTFLLCERSETEHKGSMKFERQNCNSAKHSQNRENQQGAKLDLHIVALQ